MTTLNAYTAFFNSSKRYCVLMGGAGSGKSYAAGQKVLFRLMTEPGLRVLVLRKVAATLRQSVWQLLLEQIETLGVAAHFDALPGMMVLRCRTTGATAIFRGVDDPEKIKSIQGIGAVWLEEATEFEESDFEQIAARLRGRTPGYKQIVLTLNPTQARHWICKRFFPEDYPDQAEVRGVAPNVLRLRTCHGANPAAGADYGPALEQDMAASPDNHRVYVRGRWGAITTGGEFYKHFAEGRHCGPAAYSATAPLHIGFDFNVLPYMTATLWQVAATDTGLAPTAWQVAELCLAPPDNTVEALCQAILARYGTHAGPVYIYGDPSGRAQQQATGQTHYDQIARALAPLGPQLRVDKAAPPVAMRREWFGMLFAAQQADAADAPILPSYVHLRIDPACTRTIADYLYLQEDEAGAKKKTLVKDRTTGRSYQRYGHCSDANDYLLCRLFATQYKTFARGRKLLPMALMGER